MYKGFQEDEDVCMSAVLHISGSQHICASLLISHMFSVRYCAVIQVLVVPHLTLGSVWNNTSALPVET